MAEKAEIQGNMVAAGIVDEAGRRGSGNAYRLDLFRDGLPIGVLAMA
ncbi:hypothetical protein JT737_32640 [Sinorhizobium meliloti]|nr:hypothetical protein [Sinorhizobium meliloti]MCO6426320.1 hypothetical protein [Sinorhizobium meliloti]